MTRNQVLLTSDEMPVATRALHGLALVLILLTACRFVSQACFYMDCRFAGVEMALDLGPTVGLATLTGLFVWLGSFIQKRADRT
ncbi:MAG TPA: hypothetical protein QGH10_15370 [Armatimonadota bacterium]|nr:hypothetical protein [Armatimonadota bacterium]